MEYNINVKVNYNKKRNTATYKIFIPLSKIEGWSLLFSRLANERVGSTSKYESEYKGKVKRFYLNETYFYMISTSQTLSSDIRFMGYVLSRIDELKRETYNK